MPRLPRLILPNRNGDRVASIAQRRRRTGGRALTEGIDGRLLRRVVTERANARRGDDFGRKLDRVKTRPCEAELRKALAKLEASGVAFGPRFPGCRHLVG